MADNSRKTAAVISLNAFATQKALDHIQVTGKDLPCRVIKVTGQIVTVAFQVNSGPLTLPGAVQMPLHTSAYDWLPVQVGDLGVAKAADVYLGGVSGLGGGTADLSQRANLASLVFHPIANKAWTPPGGDANKRAIQGKNGVYMQDAQGKATLTLDATNGFNLSFGGHTFMINSSGVFIDGIKFETHEHTGVTTGGSKTGGPTNP